MSQPTFEWTDEDRARLVPGCAVVHHSWSTHSDKLYLEMVLVSKVYADHVFSEFQSGLGFSACTSFASRRLDQCDPASITTAEELKVAREGRRL